MDNSLLLLIEIIVKKFIPLLLTKIFIANEFSKVNRKYDQYITRITMYVVLR